MNDICTGVRVLFTGQHWPGANSLYIARAFERCGAIVHFLNETSLWPDWQTKPGRAVRRLIRPLIEAEWNRRLLAMAALFEPDLVYVTNADFCWPPTLETLRQQKIPLMCFYHDVQWRDRPGTRFAENISSFDLVATTRKWQEPEFLQVGARAVNVVRFGYEPSVHRPMQLDARALESYQADLTFIGTRENRRARELSRLVASDFGYKFRLWGNGWGDRLDDKYLRPYWQGRLVYEQEIPVIYAASRIALHWIGWETEGTDKMLARGDQHNSRTFQIAACGGAMMLAQRTDEHRRFFEEDKEAVFFDSVDELRDKLAYWLAPEREAARRQVAAAARQRCLREDYSYVPVVRQFLEHFGLPTGACLTEGKD